MTALQISKDGHHASHPSPQFSLFSDKQLQCLQMILLARMSSCPLPSQLIPRSGEGGAEIQRNLSQGPRNICLEEGGGRPMLDPHLLSLCVQSCPRPCSCPAAPNPNAPSSRTPSSHLTPLPSLCTLLTPSFPSCRAYTL